MNYLVISPVYSPQSASGVSIVIRNICIRLLKKGIKSKILTVHHSNKNTINEVLDGVPITRLGSPASKYTYGFSPGLYKYLKNQANYLLKDIDLFHVHMYHDLMSLEAVHLIRGYGKPIVFSPHYSGLGHNSVHDILHKLYNPIGKSLMESVSVITCSSEYEAGLIQKRFNISMQKIRIIPHGVNLTAIRPHIKLASTNSSIKLLFVGRIVEHKGIQHIMQSVQKLRNDHNMSPTLDIVGSGPYKDRLIKLAHNLDIVDEIKWRGILLDDDLWKAYQQADLLILPSRFECYGLVVAESLSIGTPVIVSERGALTEFTNEPGCFSVNYPIEADELTELILEIHQGKIKVGPFNPDKIRTWDITAGDYEKLFKELSRY